MAIRFQCAACSQPIEVDDEFAQKLVLCPYCKKTVTAPSQSTLVDAEVPLASPLRHAVGEPPPMIHPRPESTNQLAVVAFGLAFGMVMCFLIGMMVVSPHSVELLGLTETLAGAGGSPEQQSKIMMDFVERHGGIVPTWFVAFMLLVIVAMMLWLAAVICGIIAARRTQRRGFAVASLVMCGVALFGALMT